MILLVCGPGDIQTIVKAFVEEPLGRVTPGDVCLRVVPVNQQNEFSNTQLSRTMVAMGAVAASWTLLTLWRLQMEA